MLLDCPKCKRPPRQVGRYFYSINCCFPGMRMYVGLNNAKNVWNTTVVKSILRGKLDEYY